MKRAIAKYGDRLDQIIFAHYGTLDVMNEVMMHNPHLLKKAVLDAGDEVYLPEVETKAQSEMGVALW